MVIAFWIVTGLAALLFLAAGGMKVVRPREQLVTSGMGWATDFSSPMVKFIGAAEVVGAIGLVVPPLTGIAPILSPIAGIALVVVMILAIIVHVRRKEAPGAQVGLAVLAAASAVLGFIVLL